MTRAKGVVLRFVASQKSTNAAVLFDGWQQITPARKNFMRVGLMADVPNQAIVRRIKRIMKRDRQFDCAERSARMAAHPGHGFKNKGTNFVGYLGQLIETQTPQVCG